MRVAKTNSASTRSSAVARGEREEEEIEKNAYFVLPPGASGNDIKAYNKFAVASGGNPLG